LSLTRPQRNINWRRLSDVNVDSVARRGDIHSVLGFVDDVTYGNPSNLNVHPNINKAFQLSQLTIQYLLHTQQVLNESGNQADAKHADAKKRVEATKSALKQQKETIQNLKREQARQEELIESYRSLLHTLNPKVARRADIQTGAKSRPKRSRRRRNRDENEDANNLGAVKVEAVAVEAMGEEEEEEEDFIRSSTANDTTKDHHATNIRQKEQRLYAPANEAQEERERQDTIENTSLSAPNRVLGVPEVRSSLEMDDIDRNGPISSLMNERDEEKVEDNAKRQQRRVEQQEQDEREQNRRREEQEKAEQQRQKTMELEELRLLEEERILEEKRLQERERELEEKEKEKDRELALERERERLMQDKERKEKEQREQEQLEREQQQQEEEKEEEMERQRTREVERQNEEREKEKQRELQRKQQEEKDQKEATRKEREEREERERHIVSNTEADKKMATDMFPGQYGKKEETTVQSDVRNNNNNETTALELFPGQYGASPPTKTQTADSTNAQKAEEQQNDDYSEDEDMLEMLDFDDFDDSDMIMEGTTIKTSAETATTTTSTDKADKADKADDTTVHKSNQEDDTPPATTTTTTSIEAFDENDSDAVQAFDDDEFESDDSYNDAQEWKKEREEEIEERKRKHEVELQAKREAEKQLSQQSGGIKPADQRKYKKAFDKWSSDDALDVENVVDLLSSLRGKLKLEVTPQEMKLLLAKMGVAEEEASMTFEQFMQGMAGREEILGR
jgi:colicin import membrane protein